MFKSGPSGFANRSLIVPAGSAGKVGATAGWVIAAADNIALVTCPASQSGSTLVVPVLIPIGAVITAFHLVGQIESAGGAVTVDANLRVMTAAAADVTDASIASMTQLAVTADTAMTSANTSKSITPRTVAANEHYYILITATTAGSTDIALQGVSILYQN